MSLKSGTQLPLCPFGPGRLGGLRDVSHRVTTATLTEWRDRFLAGGEAILKSREVDVEDEEKRRLKSANCQRQRRQ